MCTNWKEFSSENGIDDRNIFDLFDHFCIFEPGRYLWKWDQILY